MVNDTRCIERFPVRFGWVTAGVSKVAIDVGTAVPFPQLLAELKLVPVLFQLGDCAWATEVEVAMADRMARGKMIFFMMDIVEGLDV